MSSFSQILFLQKSYWCDCCRNCNIIKSVFTHAFKLQVNNLLCDAVYNNPRGFHNLLSLNCSLKSASASTYAVAMETSFKPIYPIILINACTPTDIEVLPVCVRKSSVEGMVWHIAPYFCKATISRAILIESTENICLFFTINMIMRNIDISYLALDSNSLNMLMYKTDLNVPFIQSFFTILYLWNINWHYIAKYICSSIKILISAVSSTSTATSSKSC